MPWMTTPSGYNVEVGNLRRSPYDASDSAYATDQFAADEMPPFVDLRPYLTAVEDQGELSSCTANALAGAYEYLQKRIIDLDGRVSRLFIYYNEREVLGQTGRDEGACLKDGIASLRKYGAPRESVWPYDKQILRDRPSQEAYDEGSGHRIDEAQSVAVDLFAMRHCLAEGYPFVFGIQIYKSFESGGDHGRIPIPSSGEQCCGGHAMLCVGYSDQDQMFVVRNSWGPTWGDQGHCYIPYEYFTNTQMNGDLWTIRRAHNLDFTQPNRGRQSFFGQMVDQTQSMMDQALMEVGAEDDNVNAGRDPNRPSQNSYDQRGYDNRGQPFVDPNRGQFVDQSYDNRGQFVDPNRGQFVDQQFVDPNRGQFVDQQFVDPNRGQFVDPQFVDPNRGQFVDQQFVNPNRGQFVDQGYDDRGQGQFGSKHAAAPAQEIPASAPDEPADDEDDDEDDDDE